MTDLELLLDPPGEWDRECRESGSLLYSTAFGRLLRDSLGATPLYAGTGDPVERFIVAIFSRGPFRIAYTGFPLSPALEQDHLLALTRALRALPRSTRPQLIRHSPSPFHHRGVVDETNHQPAATAIESAIEDLQTWNRRAAHASVRGDIKASENRGLKVYPATTARDAEYLYQAYRDTIRRHRGQLRYSRAYFEGILDLSTKEQGIHCTLAKVGGSYAGYVITADHRGTAYYLHGAYSPELTRYKPMAMLLSTAIEQAQSRGLRQFNFMTSPLSQPTLVRYKEKWGAVSRTQHRFDYILSRHYAQLFSMTQWVLTRTPGSLRRLAGL